MSPEDEIARGHNAARILQDGMYQESFNAVRDRLVSLLESAELDPAKRQRVNDLLVALTQTRKYLQKTLESGKMAAEQIERDKKTFAERVKEHF